MTKEEYEEYEKEYEKRIELLEKEREKYTEEEIEAFHKWAESSRQYRDKNEKK